MSAQLSIQSENNSLRRISDISFSLTSELTITHTNRSFLQLFNTTNKNLNFRDFIDPADAENLTHFLKNYSSKNNNHYCIIALLINGKPVSYILHVNKKQGKTFSVSLQDLSYAQDTMEKTILENREYTSLLNEFNAYFIVYNGKSFVLRNTKDMADVYRGSKADFIIYFIEMFKIDVENDGSRDRLNTLFSELEQGISGKRFRLLLTDNTNLLVSTLRSNARKSFASLGLIMQSNLLAASNTYSEKRDGLTELFNKKTITELATQKINVSKQEVSLFIIDVDKFKEFNDNFGHAYGDQVLVTVSKVLKEAVGDKGVAGRIGGDEFMCIVDSIDEGEVRDIARNIKQGVQWNVQATSPEQVITCSIGVARAPVNRDSYDELFKLADRALYIAKMRGRNCYIIYKPEIHDSILIEQEESERNTSSGKMFMEGALSEMSILQEYNARGKDYIQRTLYMLMEYITVHKICIYAWSAKKNAFSIYDILGKDEIDIRIPHLNNEDERYFKYHNSYGFLHLDNVNNLDTMDKDRFHMYLEDNVASTLEILWTSEDKKQKILICFDVYKPARTFQKHKIVFALLMSKLISQELSSTIAV